MQLGDATIVMDNSTGENIVPSVVAQNGANGGHEEKEREIIDEDDKINMNGGGGNRWPRQETLALLKIRSDMDGVFRDSSLKGPLWDEVSRYTIYYTIHINNLSSLFVFFFYLFL
jgi:hypothetical protein